MGLVIEGLRLCHKCKPCGSMRSKLRFLAAALMFGAAFFGSVRAEDFGPRYQAIIDSKGKAPEAQRLHELFKVDWAYTMSVSPEYATYVGVPGYDTQWTDLSTAAIAQRKQLTGRPLTVLATIDRASLTEADQVNYDLFKRQAEEALEGTKFPTELEQVNQLAGVQQDAAQLFSAMPNTTSEEVENQLARLKALPQVVDEVIALLDEGLRRGITPPQITLRDVPQQVLNQIPEEAFKSPLLLGFNDLPPTVSGEDGDVSCGSSQSFIQRRRSVYQRLEVALSKNTAGCSAGSRLMALPDGAAWYAWQIKTQTSTNLTARQIHDIGQAEVKRIREEMEKVKVQTGYKGTLAEFFVYLRTDPKFFFTDKDELLRAYRDIAKRADPQLLKLFKTLPRLTYGVVPVPA